MKTSLNASAVTEKAIAPVQLTESETDHIAGGAPTGDPGHANGEGTGAPGNGKGQGPTHENFHGRFWTII